MKTDRNRTSLWVGFKVAFVVACITAPSRQVDADEARALHKKGVALFREERYQEAAETFQKAYELRPTWKLLYNIGQCEAAAKHYGLALESFEAYLVEGGDDVPVERQESVAAEIRRIKPLVGTLDVVADGVFSLSVDGRMRATTPLKGPLRVAAGTHEVALSRDGESVLKETVHIAGGITTTVRMDTAEPTPTVEPTPTAEPAPLKEEGPQPKPSPPSPAVSIEAKPEIQDTRSALRTGGWVAVGSGAAILAGGVITGALALGKNNELADACPDKDQCDAQHKGLADEADALAVATDILLPLGGAVAIGGAVLLIIHYRRGNQRNDQSASQLTVAPVAGPDLSGIAFSGRF